MLKNKPRISDFKKKKNPKQLFIPGTNIQSQFHRKMSQFQIIIGCQFVNKGISQEVINSVQEGGGKSRGGEWENTGRTLPEKPCGILFTWGEPLWGPIAPDLDKVLLPRRADTSGDQTHSETFPACPRFQNELSLGQEVP